MRTARAEAPATRFLGVRLTAEEESLLDRFRTDRALASRSEAVRVLVKEAARPRPDGLELPVTLRAKLEELVEEGYARDLDGAVTLVLHLGLVELARTHTERLPSLRGAAREASERSADRRRADREGRGLLRR